MIINIDLPEKQKTDTYFVCRVLNINRSNINDLHPILSHITHFNGIPLSFTMPCHALYSSSEYLSVKATVPPMPCHAIPFKKNVS